MSASQHPEFDRFYALASKHLKLEEHEVREQWQQGFLPEPPPSGPVEVVELPSSELTEILDPDATLEVDMAPLLKLLETI